nr:hypothetical protein [Candidatus Bathyarchaeota archaeon]
MKLDVRSLCSRLPTYFSRSYTEHVFSEEMRLIRPLVEVEGAEEEGARDVVESLREEFYRYIEQVIEGEGDADRVKETLMRYTNWAVSQLGKVGVEK